MAGILRRKASLTVGLYGSYHPAAELKRLESLKSSIKSEGYSSVQLVREMPDLPEFKDELDKSIFSIRRSNVNLFVLTFRGQKQGAVRELDYVLKNPEHVFKCVSSSSRPCERAGRTEGPSRDCWRMTFERLG